MERRKNSRRTKTPRLALSVVLGVALVPLSAVGAVLITSHSPQIPGDEAPAVAAGSVTQPTVAQIVYSDVEATSDDLAYACGEGGLLLIEAENEGTIDGLEQSALDALRGICEAQGTPLPGKEAAPPIVETRTVVVGSAAPAPSQTPAPTSTTEPVAEDGSETAPPDNGEENGDPESHTPPPSATAEEAYDAVHDQAIAEIEYAESVGGSLEKISEARRKLAEAENAAAQGNYEQATEKAYEAIGKAREAIREDDD